MSGEVLSPNHSINKTRNAILRMKRCSPELRTVLRQKCQERIHNDRLKVLNTFRKIKIQDSFREAFGGILREEWKNIQENETNKTSLKEVPPLKEFNLDNELLLEELLEKELLLEHEDWLLQLYEELLSEEVVESVGVVCPLCCSGYLQQSDCHTLKLTFCTQCSASFVVGKSLLDLQAVIYECLAWHDKQCNYSSGFVSVPKNEKENNLCIVCHRCSHLNVIEIEGLIRKNHIPESNRPLWFDVYKRFPPKYDPTYKRLEPEIPVKIILYKEDALRALIHKKFHDRLGVVNLMDDSESISQNLLKTCQRYISEGMSENEAIEKLSSFTERSKKTD